MEFDGNRQISIFGMDTIVLAVQETKKKKCLSSLYVARTLLPLNE